MTAAEAVGTALATSAAADGLISVGILVWSRPVPHSNCQIRAGWLAFRRDMAPSLLIQLAPRTMQVALRLRCRAGAETV